MLLLTRLGMTQAILPPHERPNIIFLRNLGFYGNDVEVLKQAHKKTPEILNACYSSSGMWVANAATVSPSFDCHDRKLQITPANLLSHFHRFLEVDFTAKVLNKIFHNQVYFNVHPPLPLQNVFSDEGAANHNRLCMNYDDPGIEVFVYGKSCFIHPEEKSRKFPARQTLEASESVARRHQLLENKVLFVKQNPEAIEEGVFHNDVISVINQNVFLYHEKAFVDKENLIKQLTEICPFPIYFLKIEENELSVREAVQSYLFNSQLITLPDNTMALISPVESRESQAAHRVLERLIKEENPIQSLHFVDCRESMKNGGGPACLRLRVVMNPEQISALPESVFLTETRYQQLKAWIEKHYRDVLTPQDLLDPKLVEESYAALDALTQLLNLGSIYSFQK
jgi:succinylarginine dihydrolase